ncbi:hypothetical protein MTO96_037295 [Rhipicephalus appendiculatus]
MRLSRNSEGENPRHPAKRVCDYCRRKVKEINWLRHRKLCPRAPNLCVNTEESTESRADTKPTETKSPDEASFNTNRDVSLGDGPIWLKYLASGDWLGAFLAIKESFSTAKLDQQGRYDRLIPELVRLKQNSCVKDFLARPCPVQPFDCLLAALFARAHFTRYSWLQRQEVTWTHVLQSLPRLLVSRLSEEAVAYLSSFPVFLDDILSHEATEYARCTTSCEPPANREPNSSSEETISRSCGKAIRVVKRTEADTSKTGLGVHIQQCDLNPDNLPEWNSARATAEAVTKPPEANCLDETAFNTNRDVSFGDEPMWLKYLASGDWLGAFLAMEESFGTRMLEQHHIYYRLVPTLEVLQQHNCVRDILAQPSPVEPLDCLLAALFVRAYLPRYASLKRRVMTWTDALVYLPYCFASRLSDEAKAYLRAFPVFLDKIPSHEATENATCGTPCEPSLRQRHKASQKKQNPHPEAKLTGARSKQTGTSKSDIEEDEKKASAKLDTDERAPEEPLTVLCT